MDVFTTHHAREFEYEAADGGTLRQSVTGWVQGGCDVVWSDVLPNVVALHGRALLGERSVLELGAGCGLVGLLAGRFAARVDITDGDEQEVPLIARNVEEHAAPACDLRAVHLEWGADAAAAAIDRGELRDGARGYDVILASQVVYVPEAIAQLVETIARLLASDGYALLYNDAVSTGATQAECRALLEGALAAHGLRWHDAVPDLVPSLPDGVALPHADAYLLQICRPPEEQQWSVPKEGTAGAAGVTATDADFHPLLGVEEIRSKDDRHEATRENCNPEGEQRHVGIGRAGHSAQVIPVEEGAARRPHGHAGGTGQDHEVPDGDARAKAKREEENWAARVEGAVDGELIHTPETSKVLIVPKSATNCEEMERKPPMLRMPSSFFSESHWSMHMPSMK